MSVKAYKDKKALLLVEKLKEVIKALAIKCVRLAELGKKLTDKVIWQEQQISRLTNKVMEQRDVIDRLQKKAADSGGLEHTKSDRGIQTDRAGLTGGSEGAVGAHEIILQRTG